MNKFLFTVWIITAVPFAAPTMRAQSAEPKFPGGIRGRVVDAQTNAAIAGAVVRILSGRDSIRRTTDTQGFFSFSSLPAGKPSLKVTFLGYSPLAMEVEVKRSMVDLGTLRMTETYQEIDPVVVWYKPPLMRQEGDTIIYNPAAVKSGTYDYAVDLLERLPGVEVGEGTVSALGKDVTWAFVDGKLLFGRDVMNALENIRVSDIKSVNVYDVDNPERPSTGNTEDRQRVIDIKTRSGFMRATDAELFGGWGRDLNRSQESVPTDRYLAGGSVKLFSEKVTATAEAHGNNIGRRQFRTRTLLAPSENTAGYSRYNTARLDIDASNPFIQRKGPGMSVNYSFSDNYTSRDSRSEQVYFPPETRLRWDTTFNRSQSRTHNLGFFVSQRLSQRQNVFLHLAPTLRVTNSNSHNMRRSRVDEDGIMLTRTGTTSDNRDRGVETSGTLGISLPLGSARTDTAAMNIVQRSRTAQQAGARGVSRRGAPMRGSSRRGSTTPILTMNASWSYSDSQGDGWQVDTIGTATDPAILSTHTGGYKKRVGFYAFAHNIMVSKSLNASISYQFDYDNSKSQRMAIDTLSGEIDLNRTYDYTRNYVTQQVGSGITWRKEDKPVEVRIGLNVKTSRSNRDERAPYRVEDRRTFSSFLPSFQVGSRHSGSFTRKPTWNIGYTAYSTEPSLESMRGWLDTYNILSLQLGNPNLRQSYTHSLRMAYSTTDPEKASEFQMMFSGSYVQHAQARKSVFFSDSTWLDDHQTWAVPGATLSTWENVSGAVRSSLTAGVSRQIAKTKLILRANAGFSFSRQPAYVGEVKNFTSSVAPSANVSVQSNHSKKIEYRVGSATSYVYARNSDGSDNKTFSQRASASVTLRFTESWTLTSNYLYYLYRTGGADPVENNVLNAALGYRFYKGRGEVRFAMYDILNRTKDFSSTVMADHIVHRWQQLLSRYFTVTVGYRFSATSATASATSTPNY